MVAAFREAFRDKPFVVTAEVGPPKGTDVAQLQEHIDLLKDKVDGLNVTDNQSSVMRISSLAICRMILDRGGEPILQLTCRDRNRLALQSELLSASVLGVRSVLCLTGDFISVGDHPQAKPVFDLDSVQLLQTVGLLNGGKDLAGNDLLGPTDLFPGAVVTPEADPIEPQMIKFEKKIAAGAQFIQTQAIYDLDNFKRFMERARGHNGVKIMAGIVLLVSAGMAKYMNKNVPGIFVPDALVKEMADAPKEKRLEAGIRIAGRMIRRLREEKICDGVHIMAIGKEECVPDILKASE
ncbi:MAG TPA: methylenetetrahydrofolate reductase [Thermoguttaceae bacterium]|nr:methylenetetrahydrofolate reductase [Thermoguttaceae bacterium]